MLAPVENYDKLNDCAYSYKYFTSYFYLFTFSTFYFDHAYHAYNSTNQVVYNHTGKLKHQFYL